MDKEQSINVFNLRSINQVRSQTRCAPIVTYIQDEMAIHEFDRAMVNLSIGLYQDIIMYRLVGKIRVFSTNKGYATVKNGRHHLVTTELFVSKWGIGLEKSKETLKATT